MQTQREIISSYYVGRILGRGSFCVVKEFIPSCYQSCATDNDEDEETSILALKQPRSDLSQEEKIHANECLQNEIAYLSALCHPNIISIAELSCQENYFPKNSIAMEKLNGTLSGTIKLWKDRGTSGTKRFRHRQKCFGNNHLWQTQIRVLSEIADAMEYLHSKKIILRDLKTENCGFDSAGKIKLFDFGLATGLRDEKKVGPDRYLFSVEGGTLRYMSPEAALGNPYGKASDVYSFALLAWETTSLSIPFESMRTDEFMTRVLERHHRPKMPTKWPKDLKALLTKSWTANASARPSFLQIQRQLDRLSSSDEGEGNSSTFATKQRLQSRRYFSWILRSRS